MGIRRVVESTIGVGLEVPFLVINPQLLDRKAEQVSGCLSEHWCWVQEGPNKHVGTWWLFEQEDFLGQISHLGKVSHFLEIREEFYYL